MAPASAFFLVASVLPPAPSPAAAAFVVSLADVDVAFDELHEESDKTFCDGL